MKITKPLALCCVLGGVVSSPAALVHHWRFEGNETDTSGSGNNGTVNGGTATYVTGKFGQAIALDAGESVDILTAANLPTAGGADWSMNLWLSINSEIPGLGYIGGFGSRTDPADRTERGFLAFAGDGNDLYFWGSSADRSFAPASYIVGGQFHMYTFTYKASLNELRAYVDGALVGSGSPGNTFLQAASEVHLSGISFWNQQFAGSFDEFSIWSETLSAAQIASLYSSNTIPAGTVTIPATPALTFAGSNVVCNAVATGLTAPVTYQWQKGTNGNYVNLVDGGNVSGATTSNLTLVVTLADNADFRVIATGTSGSATSDPAAVRVLSALLDISSPGDVVTIMAGGTPGGEGVEHVIDNNTDKYLNFDADASPPFVGPMGFTLQPAAGYSVVSALRFYTANDAEGRDPVNYTFAGSLDGVVYTTISSGPLALPSGRNAGRQALNPLTQNIQEVRFNNTNGYTRYRLSFNNVKDNNGENNMQIGEVEFLGVVIPNSAPVAQPIATTVYRGSSVGVRVIGGKFAPTDADNDPLTVSAVATPTANGGSVSTDGTNINYIASDSYSGLDSFPYTVTDGKGGFATNTITVTVQGAGNGANIVDLSINVPTATISALGLPGQNYKLQHTDSLNPVNWNDTGDTDIATSTGAVTLTDSNAPMSGRYYRTVAIP